ncbi:hypothetical protein [Methylococcus sp. EFPC2]|uniref:hypothetical protein n=1 Tax=Methylococcus sp. EFPC2 TaxID=2812648 RepID=UPI0019672FC3|nr:hypothetical protein [Methylococcus sp. EFPC2]QSA95628.1 hypothetical protein JWZ97_10215 [Methylococcus sp. EFPC2]
MNKRLSSTFQNKAVGSVIGAVALILLAGSLTPALAAGGISAGLAELHPNGEILAWGYFDDPDAGGQ